ncbi:Metallo-hydrolase/oxidoreductase [Lyophyllum atratum]|nr:Metallo-hydrolase/oxidoreductase [Lyophyllum atratum]
MASEFPAAAAASISVTAIDRKASKLSSGTEKSEAVAAKPEHWDDSKCSGFHNPWPSWRSNGIKDAINSPSPTWGAVHGNGEESVDAGDKIKATWLGHACFLVEMPSRAGEGERGARILFDPVFSDRCSPSQWVGPKRFTPPPCAIEEIPEVDAVVISHNNYDHLDTHTIRILSQRCRKPHFFAPLGNGGYFKSFDIPDTHLHIMDWWESKRIEVCAPSDDKDEAAHKVTVDITCTPAQHFTGRSLFDRFKTLWASWVVEEVHPTLSTPHSDSANAASNTTTGVKVFFGGDTGYRAVLDGQDEDDVPVCPAFKEIGERFGGFDFATIPIGAYMPRQFMSPIHCAPQDSVRLFKDIRAKRALGMHWGRHREPPKKLAEECKKIGIEDGAFGVCDIGQTMFF